jgi:hypothetical protein
VRDRVCRSRARPTPCNSRWLSGCAFLRSERSRAHALSLKQQQHAAGYTRPSSRTWTPRSARGSDPSLTLTGGKTRRSAASLQFAICEAIGAGAGAVDASMLRHRRTEAPAFAQRRVRATACARTGPRPCLDFSEGSLGEIRPGPARRHERASRACSLRASALIEAVVRARGVDAGPKMAANRADGRIVSCSYHPNQRRGRVARRQAASDRIPRKRSSQPSTSGRAQRRPNAGPARGACLLIGC